MTLNAMWQCVVSGFENGGEYNPNLIDFQQPKKLLKTSSGRRFNPPAIDEDIVILSKGCIPKNTVKSNTWALRVFHD